ncbi:MAG: hypothetical protein SNF33_00470 [Candidatus Algichlamydia australiensis]|nr:hypothetical protein [Chlamydiales bacterium]
MLSFFRRYQKIIYSVVAVFIICSFSFFGTFSSFLGESSQPKDRVVGRLLGGKKLKESDLRKAERFLSSDMYDVELMQKGSFPNAFNDGVLRRDFFETPLAQKVAVRYFDEIQGELAECLEKGKRFTPYTHPSFGFLSAEAIWNMWRPEISEHLQSLKTQKLAASAVKTLGQLYLDQGHFPSHFLRQFLLSQEKQHEWIPHDPQLERADLALCHNHSLEDWVGPRFVQICAQLVLNGAALAEERGFKVSLPEAHASMVRNAVEFLQFELKKQEISQEEITNFIQRNLHVLGMNEQEAATVWQKVLLFRSLLENVGSVAFLDSMPYKQFHEYADSQVLVNHYTLPEAFQLKDVSSKLCFQKYIDLVGERVSGKALPRNMRPTSAICPELREEAFKLCYSSVNEDEIALSIGTKDLWDYKLANFSKILKRCPASSVVAPESLEEKLQLLENLKRHVRAKVDSYAAELMIQEHPEWIEEALAKGKLEEKQLYIPLKGEIAELAGIPDANALLKALRKGESRFCGDGKTHYKFEKVESIFDDRVLTFAEAQQRGILKQLVRADLEKAYQKIRESDAKTFQDEKGVWKQLDDVYNIVAEQHYARIGNADKRLETFVKRMRERVKTHKDIALKGDLETQWELINSQVKVARKAIPEWMQKEDFTQAGLSDVQTKNVVCFYEVLEKTDEPSSLLEPMRQGRELLSHEIKGHFMEELLEKAPIYNKAI